MKIKETIERECCDANRDLKRLLGSPTGRPYYFCVHCGGHFEDQGGSEPESPGIQPLPWPWEWQATADKNVNELCVLRGKIMAGVNG